MLLRWVNDVSLSLSLFTPGILLVDAIILLCLTVSPAGEKAPDAREAAQLAAAATAPSNVVVSPTETLPTTSPYLQRAAQANTVQHHVFASDSSEVEGDESDSDHASHVHNAAPMPAPTGNSFAGHTVLGANGAKAGDIVDLSQFEASFT